MVLIPWHGVIHQELILWRLSASIIASPAARCILLVLLGHATIFVVCTFMFAIASLYAIPSKSPWEGRSRNPRSPEKCFRRRYRHVLRRPTRQFFEIPGWFCHATRLVFSIYLRDDMPSMRVSGSCFSNRWRLSYCRVQRSNLPHVT